jgi:hypothetical protein
VLSTLRKDLTAAAAQTRSAAIRHAKEGRRSSLRAAVAATYPWQASNILGGFCRMPSAPLTLDPSQQQEEGRP